MIRHCAMFRFTDESTEESKKALGAALGELPREIPEIRAFAFGPDAGINAGNFEYVVVGDFETVEDYLVYRDHPVHAKLIADHVVPIVASRAAVQFEIKR